MLRSAAIYGLGEAALREGLYDEAAQSLTNFILNYPDDPRVPQATFLRGDAYLGLSEWQLAIDDFNTYLALRPGIIDSYAHERIGDAFLALGQPEESLAAYARAVEATVRWSRCWPCASVAAGYVNAGRPRDAVAQYDAILAEARNGPYRASIQYQAAQVLLNMNDVAGAHPPANDRERISQHLRSLSGDGHPVERGFADRYLPAGADRLFQRRLPGRD